MKIPPPLPYAIVMESLKRLCLVLQAYLVVACFYLCFWGKKVSREVSHSTDAPELRANHGEQTSRRVDDGEEIERHHGRGHSALVLVLFVPSRLGQIFIAFDMAGHAAEGRRRGDGLGYFLFRGPPLAGMAHGSRNLCLGLRAGGSSAPSASAEAASWRSRNPPGIESLAHEEAFRELGGTVGAHGLEPLRRKRLKPRIERLCPVLPGFIMASKGFLGSMNTVGCVHLEGLRAISDSQRSPFPQAWSCRSTSSPRLG